jgi:hypothetical protein
MHERIKLGLLVVGVTVLVAISVLVGVRSMRRTAEPRVSAAFQKLTPAQQERLLDEGERERRAVGKPHSRHLPEDPPGYPPGSQ